jgi:D,D-heptose 1,7-bisphosphate phosphatase
MNKALFLDRDGVINVDKGYVYRWEEIEWIPEIFEAIKMANERGYKVIVLTNQSGIFRNFYTHEDVHLLHAKMSEFLKAKGLVVDDWFYCAELDSEDRKPRPGMLLKAQKKHNIELEKSFMIGDKPSDVFELEGEKIGPLTYLIKGRYDHKEDNNNRVTLLENHSELIKLLNEKL